MWATSSFYLDFLISHSGFKKSTLIVALTVPRPYFFCGAFMFFLSCVCICACLLYVTCGHLLGKRWPLGSRLWCLSVSLSLSNRYPGSGEVLNCIESWSLHPYLLWVILYEVQPKVVTHLKDHSTLAFLSKNILISQPNHMLWVLKRTVSMRRFFWAPKTYVNPKCASSNKSRLLFSSAEMFKKPLWQTVWTQIRLLL